MKSPSRSDAAFVIEWTSRRLPPDGGRASERRRIWLDLAETLRRWIETYGDVRTLREFGEEEWELAETLAYVDRESKQMDPDPPPCFVRWRGEYLDLDYGMET